MRRAWKLLVDLLVIAVLSLWWWTWRVEGLLVLHLLLLVVVILIEMEHSTRSRVVSVDCWFFMNSLLIAFIMA
jgi:hypothetical protein